MVSGVLGIVLFFVVLLGILVYVLDGYKKKSLKKLIENYDESENKSRREPEESGEPGEPGEPEQRGRQVDRGAGRDTELEESDSSVSSSGNFERQSSVPIPTPSSVGKDKPKLRKVSGIFRRFKRRKSK